MNRLLHDYNTALKSKLSEELGIGNQHALPKILKIVVNVGWGELKGNEPLQKSVADGLSRITGQKPILTRSKKAIAGFKLRQNDAIGYCVTLRSARMYDFLDRLITYVFPRLRDFQGISNQGFDGHGNYSFGLREQSVFPEIPFQGNERTWGMQVTIVTSASEDSAAKALLEKMGFPFAKTDSLAKGA